MNIYDRILKVESEITDLTMRAARLSIISSHLGVKLENGSYEIYCIWEDDEAKQLYDNILALAAERSADLAKLKAQVK